MKEIIEILTKQNKTISTMESCTGGGVANEITNIEGASTVLKFSAVTYSNEFKIKMGVNSDIIDKYSVYSEETAKEMSKNISLFTNSNYGVGITGKLNRVDENNLYGKDNIVFISIYDKDEDKFYNESIEVTKQTRKKNKELVIKKIESLLLKILKKKLNNKEEIDHVDIVTSHICNKRCEFCIDKFLGTSKDMISINDIDKFLKLISNYTDKKVEVLLLGGEPTVLPKDKLIEIANLVHSYAYPVMMSTNGILRNKIIDILPYYDFIQVTVNSDEEIDYYRKWSDKINIKLAGDASLDMNKLYHFIEYTKGFKRRSISMYFTNDFKELCNDKKVWELLDSLTWERNGSYMYTFYKGVRIKKCIHGKTNIIDEPTVPKLYPNGNYNKTWNDEELDDYLSLDGKKWKNEKTLAKVL